MADSDGEPGWLGKLGAVVARPFEEAKLREERARYERLSYEAANRFLAEAAKFVRPEDDDFTQLLFSADGKRELDEGSAEVLREKAREFAQRQPHAIGYLRTLKRFVVGKGPTIVAATDDEELNERIDEWWERWTEANDWDTKEDELAARVWRDGEMFLRKFVHRFDGPDPDMAPSREAMRRLRDLGFTGQLRGPDLPAGMVQIRFVDPEQVKDPRGLITHGIVTAENDVETVLAYLVQNDPTDDDDVDVVTAEEMIHAKINSDSNVKRGRTQLEAILRRAKQYDQWLDYRIMLNLARTAVVLVKKIQGTPQQMRDIREQQQKQRSDVPNSDRRQRAFRPMTTVHSTAGIEYEFKAPNIQAADAQKDGRSILLNMAAATGVPEFMFTGDASNANYSSTLVSKGPAVREFESWQDFLDPYYAQVWSWVVTEAARHNQIEGLQPEDAEDLKPSIEWEPPDVPDELAHTQRNQLLNDSNILSDEGWARDEGIDWDTEKDRIERERREKLEFSSALFGDGPPGTEDDENDEGDDG